MRGAHKLWAFPSAQIACLTELNCDLSSLVDLLFSTDRHSKNGGLQHVLQEGEEGDRWRVPSLRRVRGQPSSSLSSSSVGMVALDEEKDIEKVYLPMNSRAMKDRQYV